MSYISKMAQCGVDVFETFKVVNTTNMQANEIAQVLRRYTHYSLLKVLNLLCRKGLIINRHRGVSGYEMPKRKITMLEVVKAVSPKHDRKVSDLRVISSPTEQANLAIERALRRVVVWDPKVDGHDPSGD